MWNLLGITLCQNIKLSWRFGGSSCFLQNRIALPTPGFHKTARSQWPLPGLFCKGILARVFIKQPISWLLVTVGSFMWCMPQTSWLVHAHQFLLFWSRNQSWSFLHNTSLAFFTILPWVWRREVSPKLGYLCGIRNQQDVTWCFLYFLFISSSTCFGQPCAHPQELTTQWFYRRVWCSAVTMGRPVWK